MKFTIKKDEIVKILSKVQGITSKNNNLAATRNVFIRVDRGNFFLRATDLETGFEGNFYAEVEESGSISINSRKLYEILKEFPEKKIVIKQIAKNMIRVSNKTICYDIVGDNFENFPRIIGEKDVLSFNINTKDFRDAIKKNVIIATKNNEKRVHIKGSLVEVIPRENKHFLRMISTDASRLTITTSEISDIKRYSEKQKNEILIPKKGLSELLKFIDDDTLLNVSIKNNVFIAKKERETIIIRLLEGSFPDYGPLTEKKTKHRIELNKNSFMKTLKRMSILASDKYNSICLLFNKNKIMVIAENIELGNSKEEVRINFQIEKKMEIAFNPKFLMEIIGVAEDENILIEITDEKKPCVIKGVEFDNFVSVIMPMRL